MARAAAMGQLDGDKQEEIEAYYDEEADGDENMYVP